MSSVGSEAGSEEGMATRSGDIVRTGYMKKLKTMRKKFFVLRSDSQNFPACLEYYDNGKKWKNKHPPKRSIVLKNCFSVHRCIDTKHKYVISLFTGFEGFGIVLESEEDLQEWMRLLLMYQYGEDISGSYLLKPYYEHVWKVTVQRREVACKTNLSGTYLLCVTETTLSLVKPAIEEGKHTKIYEFLFPSIRRCGNLDTLVYMELGQASCIGPGNLWVEVDDTYTARRMNSVIRKGFVSCPKKEFAPKSRSRSSSVNESSRPVHFGRKWPSIGDDSLSVLSGKKPPQEHAIMSPNSVGLSVHPESPMGDGVHHHHHHHHCHHNPNPTSTSQSPYPPTRRASTGTRPVTIGPALLSSSRMNTAHTGRERCDSMPTRSRMTLEALSSVKTGNPLLYSSTTTGRPCSMYSRHMFSPSGPSHPTSPTSATYSNDSAGSSLSVDVDNDSWSEMDNPRRMILEERGEEYVQWDGDQSKNFLSENIPLSHKAAAVSRNNKFSIGQNSSSASQSSCSPCSTSPIDASTYLPMSPIESITDNRVKQPLNHSYDSTNHSRESSINEDLGEGYVSMAPLSADASYMTMDQIVLTNKHGDLSPGLSNCSIASGTPSTDCRFSEFHLDKVSSYLTPSDDDIVFNVRQTRAYSAGSKPDAKHNKFIRCDSSEGLRTRAFSVGSKCSSNLTPRRTPNSTSTSSIEPCDDLMEMDFSANKYRRRNLQQQRLKKQQSAAKTSNIAEKLATKHPVPHSYTLNDVYMDMSKPSPKLETFSDSRGAPDPNQSPPRLSKHLVGRSPSSNMNYGKQVYVKSSPITATGVLAKVVETESQSSLASSEDSYMEMKPGVCDMPNPSQKVIPVIATATNLHARKENLAALDPASTRTPTLCPTLPHIKQPLLETDGKQFRQSPMTPPDGYIDMSFKGRRMENHQSSKPIAKAAAAAAEKPPEGYVDMSFNKNSRKNLVDSNSSRKKPGESKNNSFCCTGKENQVDTRPCSKPIAIQQGKNKRPQAPNLFRRHKSEETQTSKPNFLPLGFNIPASLTLGRKKKCCQKKEKSESPVGLSAVTVFPLSPDRDSNLKYGPGGGNVRPHGDYYSLERVDEMVNWDRRCGAAEYEEAEYDENSEYILMTPAAAQKLHRKVSEPTFMKYSGRSECLVKETKDTINKSLQRSTSVPSTISKRGGRRRSPSSSKFDEVEDDDIKSRSDSEMNCAVERPQQRTEADVSVMSPNNASNVPNASVCHPCSPSYEREKVMYVSLDVPPSEQEPSAKSGKFASSNIQSDESNLIYAQIDFNKRSGSSSPSK